jgi:basic membrane protein A and related proteins
MSGNEHVTPGDTRTVAQAIQATQAEKETHVVVRMTRNGMFSRFGALAGAAGGAALLAACGGPGASSAGSTGSTGGAPGSKPIALKPGEKLKVGFLYVGPKTDFGYNYAADQGRLAMEKKLPYVETLVAENVPENAEAERVMEQMIRGGAKIIFPTSYGHLDPAMKVAAKYKDVVFLHQGGLKNTENVGTYFGEIWQPVFAGGVAAGKVTKTNKLGFIVAHPIPQVLLNVNAFHLGARSVNPNVTTTVVFTADWCNPGKNTEAANSLIDQGADVLTQHQDCTLPVIEVAERKGVYTVGYHADASPRAPKSWLTGAMWTWGDLYASMIQQVVDGKWTSSLYRAGLKDKIVDLAPFGPAVPDDVRRMVTQLKTDVIEGKTMPFQGPVKDQTGRVRIEQGVKPDTKTLETMDWLAEGVVGSIPK